MVILNEKYKRIGSDAKFSIVTGGRGSGKSFAITYLINLLSYESGHVILYTRYTLRSANISIIPEFLEKIELMGKVNDFIITKDEIINKVSGSRILFRGIKTSSGDQTANLKSINGLSTWVLDEAEELVDEDKFDTINLSVRQKGVQNRVILLMNPATKEHWIYKRFFEERGVEPGSNLTKDDTNYIHTTYLDNKYNLSDSYIKDITRLKNTNPDKYNHKILGGWLAKAEGVVFTNWEIGEFNPNNLQTSFGQDYGFSVDPTTLIEVAIDQTNRKIWVKQHIYKKELTTSQIGRLNESHAKKKLIWADSAEPRLIEELRRKGNNVKSVKKVKIEERVEFLKDFEIIVDPSSTDIVRELNNYVYLDKGSKMYVDDFNHALDAIGYNVTGNIIRPQRKLTDIR